jgi:hypothetical protein
MLYSKTVGAPQFVYHVASVDPTHVYQLATFGDTTFWFEKEIEVRFGATAEEFASGTLEHFPIIGPANFRCTIDLDSRFMSVKAPGGTFVRISVAGQATGT